MNYSCGTELFHKKVAQIDGSSNVHIQAWTELVEPWLLQSLSLEPLCYALASRCKETGDGKFLDPLNKTSKNIKLFE